MNLIVSADKHWSIGKNGRPTGKYSGGAPAFIKGNRREGGCDGKENSGNTARRPAPGRRTNVVLSADPSFKARGAVVFRSMEETLAYLEEFDPKDIYILGGESIYRQFLLTAIPFISLPLIMFMTQICVSLWIWIRLRTGNWQRRGKNRLILTSAILFAAM